MSRFENRTTLYFSLLGFSTLTVSSNQVDIRKFSISNFLPIGDSALQSSLSPLHVGCKVFSELKLNV